MTEEDDRYVQRMQQQIRQISEQEGLSQEEVEKQILDSIKNPSSTGHTEKDNDMQLAEMSLMRFLDNLEPAQAEALTD